MTNLKAQTIRSQWKPDSWRSFPIKQMPEYENLKSLHEVESNLRNKPPLVVASEIDHLKNHFAKAARGEAFILQGGDCAESFRDFSTDSIRDTFKLFLQMSAVMMYAAHCPIIKIGRMAGQFAKPRSDDFETIDGVSLPSYRGDIINATEFNDFARKPDPTRMMKAYHQSSTTLNLLRAFSTGGFANLRNARDWTLEFVKSHEGYQKYEEIAKQISNTIEFILACGISEDASRINQTEFYTSHESLLLWYEEGLTRQSSHNGKWYNCAAHMIWIGERTRNLDGAHLEYARGIENPIGVKFSANAEIDDLIKIIDLLNPDNHEGKIMLISRMGIDKIERALPPIVRKLKTSGRHIVWSCDPMHGNTIKTTAGYKTRKVDSIFEEVKKFADIVNAENTPFGGIHFEMTGLDVTECTGGANAVNEKDLQRPLSHPMRPASERGASFRACLYDG